MTRSAPFPPTSFWRHHTLMTSGIKLFFDIRQKRTRGDPFHFHELRAFSKRRIDLSFIQNGTNLCSHRPTRTLRYTGAEPIAESAMDFSQVLHTAGAGGLASLRLLAPVVCKKR
ncbi:hypothetical protein VTN49DRAFT_1745 [Thermomyces lanuginosus]|uniref:uncharacterized protein n=1 Tax=Thermomyces lanuginosus TaxID=5541 RepID=UPI0037441B4B